MARTSAVLLTGLALLTMSFSQTTTPPGAAGKQTVQLRDLHQTAFKPGEKLTYVVHYGWVNAGEAVVELKASDRDVLGRDVWLATGKGRTGLDAALRAVQLQGLFDASRTADQTAGKPDPLMLHELAREFDLPPERILMVGDTTHDLQMARNAGCASVGVSYGAHPPDGFAALQPLFVADTVRDLHRWLVSNA